MSKMELDQELSRNFHHLWDNFPFPVMLIRKDRTILDRNRAAEAVGCTPGTRCIDAGKKEDHDVCLANQALREGAAKRLVDYIPVAGRVLDTYWIPVEGHEGLFLHFSTDITDYAADRLLPPELRASGSGSKQDCAGAEGCGAAEMCNGCPSV